MKKLFLLIFISMVVANAMAQVFYSFDSNTVDSLERVYHSYRDKDTNKLHSAYLLSIGHSNLDSAMQWSQRLEKLAILNKHPFYRANALRLIGVHYSKYGDLTSAINNEYRAIIIADSIHDDGLKAKCLVQLGSFYTQLNNFAMAVDFYTQSLNIWEPLNDYIRISDVYRNLGFVFQQERAWEKSINIIEKALGIDSVYGNEMSVMLDYIYLAYSFIGQYEFCNSQRDVSLCGKAKECLIHVWESSVSSVKFDCCNLLPVILYYELRDYGYTGARRQQVLDSMTYYINEGYACCKNYYSDFYKIRTDYALVCSLMAREELESSKHILDSLDNVLSESKSIKDCYYAMHITAYKDYYYIVGDIENYSKYYDMLYDFSMNTISSDVTIDASLKLAENDYKAKLRDRDLSEQRRHYVMILSIVVVALILLFVAIAYVRNLRVNKVLSEKNSEIRAQSEDILIKNKKITDSINYASLIQKAAMPSADDLHAIVNDYFMIYKPLDVVAGDFFWASSIDRYKIVVCADCTGHGVPGAFISMLGISLLNELTATINETTTAANILDKLRRKVKSALGQDIEKYQQGKKVNMDGMDMSLVILDTYSNILQYAGAYRPLWIWSNGVLSQYKADRMPIGLYLVEEKPFSNILIQLNGGETLYMFSDGIPDQFGAESSDDNKQIHFGNKRLAQLIEKVADLPMHEQQSIIESSLRDFSKGHEQLDDMVLMGLRFS